MIDESWTYLQTDNTTCKVAIVTKKIFQLIVGMDVDADSYEYHWTGRGDEELMKKLVAKYGAVVTSVVAAGPFSQYGGGILRYGSPFLSPGRCRQTV